MLSQVLMVSHMGLANATKTPELELDKTEADALANATAKVMEAFDVRPDPRFVAVAGLVSVAGSVYGPRIYMIQDRHKTERKNRPPKDGPPSNQSQFDPFVPNQLGG